MSAPALVLVNGSWTPAFSPLDRGLMYGDGVFRTLRLRNGRPAWWQDQLARLDRDCGRLALQPPAHADWNEDIDKIVSRTADAAVKLIVTRGVGERGYQPSSAAPITRIAIATQPPEYRESLLASGVHVRRCRLRLGDQPALAGVKHLNRLENVLARMEWSDPEIREGLLLDQAGDVVSGVSSNVVVIRQGMLTTPPLDRCGVAGVARDRVMGAAGRVGLTVRVQPLSWADLLAAEEIWLCNSLIRLWWVASLEGHQWSTPRFHPQMLPLLDD